MDIKLTLDPKTFNKAMAFLLALKQAGPQIVAEELNKIAFRWQGEIQRHMPVDQGLARASIHVIPADPTASPIVAIVGTNVPYVPYLEFGWQGGPGLFGSVYTWKFGDEPVTRWYAKDHDLALLEHHGLSRYWSESQGKYIVKKVKPDTIEGRLKGARAPESQEFAPPFRGSWELIADKVLDGLRDRLANLLKEGVIK